MNVVQRHLFYHRHRLPAVISTAPATMGSSGDVGSGGGGGDGSPRRRHNARGTTSPDAERGGLRISQVVTDSDRVQRRPGAAGRSPRPQHNAKAPQSRLSSTALLYILLLMVTFVMSFLGFVVMRAQRTNDSRNSSYRDAPPAILGRAGRTGTNAKHQLHQFHQVHSSAIHDDKTKRRRRAQLEQQQRQDVPDRNFPIAISVDAGSLSVSSGYELPNAATAMAYQFGSGMMENDKQENDEQQHEQHSQTWTANPDPHAALPDGKIDVLQRQAAWKEQCEPLPVWIRTFRPVCNVVHEVDLDVRDMSASKETDTTFLSAGGSWRMAWKIRPRANLLDIEEAGESRRAYLVNKFNSIPELLPPKEKKNCTDGKRFNVYGQTVNCTDGEEANDTEADGIDDADYGHSMVLKMLRIDRPYTEEAFSHNQVDVMAMDRFTASPFVIDAYAFCGMSVMTEVAGGSGRDLVKRTDIEPKKRLRIARNLAMGLSQIHGDREGRDASLVHNDLNLENLVLVKTSTIKFNDFNIAVMNRRHSDTEQPCGHPVLFESPLWRSPEEIRDDGTYVNEKIDIYAFGNILFQILTKHQPWTWLELTKPTIEEISEKKMRGELPRIPEKYTDSDNMAEQALYIATMMCYAFDPAKRPSAWQLANALAKAHIEFAAFKKGKRKDLTFDELQTIFGL